MSLRQLYYTSCRNAAASRTGFQVKAASSDIPQSVMDTLNKIMGYTIPPGLRNQPIDTHPIALRYTYLNPQAAVLLCSQSNGDDEFGRPGNYFAHVVIGEPEKLATSLPITYWKSPFWISHDDSDKNQLAVDDDFTAEQDFDYDTIWTFIDAPTRRDWLRSLLAAIIQYEQTGKKIIILDTSENIVQWIYAASMALPSRYRPMLTFSTYHHDPIYAPFIINGTTSDSNFRFTREDSMNYFVMNAETNQISQVQPSDFANYIADRFNERQYDNEILEFFDWLESGRKNQLPTISTQLDNLVNFYLATVKSSIPVDSARAISGARGLINEIVQTNSTQAQDIEDLHIATDLLGDSINRTANADLIPNYAQALQLLKPLYPQIEKTCERTCWAFLNFVLLKQVQAATNLRKIMGEIYNPETIRQTINRPDILQTFTPQLRRTDIEQITIFWEQMAGYLSFEASTQAALMPAFNATFGAIPSSPNHLSVPDNGLKLINLLLQVMLSKTDMLLKIAYDYRQRTPQSPIVEWIYYALVGDLPLNQRATTYWLYWEQMPDVLLSNYELQRDLDKPLSLNQLIKNIQAWVEVYTPNFDSQSIILENSLNFLWERNGTDRGQLARLIILDPLLEPLLKPAHYDEFARAILNGAQMGTPDELTAAVYQRFLTRSGLTLDSEQRFIIEGAIALSNKLLPSDDQPLFRQWKQKISTASPTQYQEVFKTLMDRNFAENGPANHVNLICLAYDTKHREEFWDAYWQRFRDVLLKEDMPELGKKVDRVKVAIGILDTWFKNSFHLFESYPYVVPEFFTRLLEVLETIHSDKVYSRISRQFEKELSEQDWYPVVQDVFNKRKGLLGGFFR